MPFITYEHLKRSVMNKNELEIAKLVLETSKRMSDAGFVLGTWGNVSIRVNDKFVITPSGMAYSKMNPKDMVIVNIDGDVVEGKWKPSTETSLHATIYHARTDANAVLHTHSIFASAVAVTRSVIPPIVEDLVQIVGGSVEVAPYALSGTQELRQNVVELLSDRNAVLLANHGMVGIGKDVEEAWVVCEVVEKAARILVYSKILGTPVVLDDGEVKRLKDFFRSKYGLSRRG